MTGDEIAAFVRRGLSAQKEMIKLVSQHHGSRRAVQIDPVLPAGFDNTPNEVRPQSHQKRWNVPYIVAQDFSLEEKYRAGSFKQWSSGARYDVRCLDGGA